MNVPPRPEHVVTRREQLQGWSERLFERLRATRSPGPDAVSNPSMLPGLLIGAAVAVLGLGAVWGWQAWSGRVSVPIDERLPMLVLSGDSDRDTPAPSVEPAATEPAPVDAPPIAEALAARPVEHARVIVHVAGAVMSPGVVTLESGARVIDALEHAGGPTPEADLDRVNLAALVIDGERIHVPAHGEDQPPVVVAPDRSGGTLAQNDIASNDSPEAILDINVATAEALEALPGVGPSIAQAIVQTRVNRGPFLLVDELLDVPGIGEAKLAQIEPHVRVG